MLLVAHSKSPYRYVSYAAGSSKWKAACTAVTSQSNAQAPCMGLLGFSDRSHDKVRAQERGFGGQHCSGMLLSGIPSGPVLQQRQLPLLPRRLFPGPKTQRKRIMVAAALTEAPPRNKLKVFQASELSHAQLKELTARPRIDFKTIGHTASLTRRCCTWPH